MNRTLNLWIFGIGVLLLISSCNNNPEPSKRIIVKGYDRHVELQWEPVEGAKSYAVFVKKEDNSYTERANVQDTIYMDFVNDLGTELELSYKVEAQLNEGTESLGEVTVATRSMTDEELLDMVQYYTFRYFWEGAEPNSGMARERVHMDGNYPQNDQNVVTTGGTGFGIFGLLAGIERNWVSKEEGIARFERIVDFLEKADRFHGVWPHWIHGESGKVKPFGNDDDGGDLVESAFLMQGLLAVREYYKNGTEREKQLAQKIDELWNSMEWNWYTQGG